MEMFSGYIATLVLPECFSEGIVHHEPAKGIIIIIIFFSSTGTKLVSLQINWSHSVDVEWHVWNGSYSMEGWKVPANDVALPRCIITEIL